MTTIHTVLCPVDFSPATRPQVQLAGAICHAFGARLVLHHNIGTAPPAMGVGWMWHLTPHKFESDDAVQQKLEALRQDVPDVRNVAVTITRGTITQAVLDVGEQFEADLVVLSMHGVSTDDHKSITEQIVDRGRGAVMVLHDSDRQTEFALRGTEPVIVVPTDLSRSADAAVAAGFMFTRVLSAHLHIIRLVPEPGASQADRQRNDDGAIQRTRALVPADIADRVVIDVELSIAVDSIVDAASR
jgi:hypothetical protein